MSGERLRAMQALNRSIGVPVRLVTEANVQSYVKPGHALHAGFEYLSAIHRSDYLAAYLSHHYGGGYHDVKRPHGSWAPHFERFANDPGLWLYGPREQRAGAIACKEVAAWADAECVRIRAARGETRTSFRSVRAEPRGSHINGTVDRVDKIMGACCERVRNAYARLVTVQAFIARPRTALTADWLRLNHERLDYRLDELRAHPARFPRCCHKHEDAYPIGWNDLKGGALHPLMLKYAEHVGTGMPRHAHASYRDPASEDRPYDARRAGPAMR